MSKVRGLIISSEILFKLVSRCTALSSKLDHDFHDAVPRSPEDTDALMRSVGGDVKRLWEGYGIIADIEV